MQNDRCTRARGVKPELPQLRVEKPAETLEGMVLFGLGDDGAPAPLTPPRELWPASLGRNLGFGRRLPLTPLFARRYAVTAGERDHHGAHGVVQGAAARGAPPHATAPATLPAVPAAPAALPRAHRRPLPLPRAQGEQAAVRVTMNCSLDPSERSFQSPPRQSSPPLDRRLTLLVSG